jgi:hypothetical protein
MKTRITAVLTSLGLAAAVFLAGAPAAQAVWCNDGTWSNSSGRGTCSWHGGIDRGASGYGLGNSYGLSGGGSSYNRWNSNSYGNSNRWNSNSYGNGSLYGNSFDDPYGW